MFPREQDCSRHNIGEYAPERMPKILRRNVMRVNLMRFYTSKLKIECYNEHSILQHQVELMLKKSRIKAPKNKKGSFRYVEECSTKIKEKRIRKITRHGNESLFV